MSENQKLYSTSYDETNPFSLVKGAALPIPQFFVPGVVALLEHVVNDLPYKGTPMTSLSRDAPSLIHNFTESSCQEFGLNVSCKQTRNSQRNQKHSHQRIIGIYQRSDISIRI